MEYDVILSTTDTFPIFPEEFINALEVTLLVPFEETNNIVDGIEIKQTLFTEAERLDEIIKPGKLMDELINRCVGAEPPQGEKEEHR